MQNWDRNRQDVKFKQKLNNVKSTLPKISYTNNSGPSIISKKSQNSGNNQNLNNLEYLYMNVTYKMKQGANSSGSNPSSDPTSASSPQGSIPILSKTKNNDMKHQNYLKHLLNEFGLSQYLRKLYELGYDDNNINKIGLMNRKSFQELLNNMKMFPGQSIKMEKLYDYLKQLNLANTMYNTRLLGGRTNMRNIPKKPLTSDAKKRRINTASAHNNVLVNNNNIYSNNNNMNYGNNNINNNYNYNNQVERPKTSTFKMKPIQRMQNNYQNNNVNKVNSKTLDNNINNQGYFSPNYVLSNKNQNDFMTNKNKSNNILLNSFKKGDLGYGFYMNNIEDAKNQKNENNINNNYFTEKKVYKIPKEYEMNNNSPKPEFNKFENINGFSNLNNNNNDGELIEEKMTEDIDNMLKYYMVQLNEKLDDSYGSIEDSSLSYNVSLPIAESFAKNNNKNNNVIKNQKETNKNNYINNNTNNNKNINVNNNLNNPHPSSGKIKLPTIKDKQNTPKDLKSEKSNEKIKNKENQNQVLRNQKNAEAKQENINKNETTQKENIPEAKKEKQVKETKEVNEVKEVKEEKEAKENKENKENKEIKEVKEDKENKGDKQKNDNNSSCLISNNISKISDDTNINKKAEIKNDSFIEDIILDDDNANKEDTKKEVVEKKNENIQDNKNEEIKKETNAPMTNNILNSNAQNLKESKDKDIDENIEIIEDKKEDSDPEIKYGFHGEKTDVNENKPQQTQNERYSLEENIYDNLRLTKSSGGDYLHQNMEKFDIEYMCRCLSLAIMKLLESGKGKQHITDIMEKENEKFEFFNNLFNSNMDIISEFFGKNKDGQNNDNTAQKISNLEKLELKENKIVDDNNDITLLKHIKKDIDDKLLKDQEIKNKQFKLKNNLADIEKDIEFIDEFFSMGRKRVKNYQNISEKSKNVLNKELSYINEVDSEINNTNKTNSIISNNDKNNFSKHSVNENSNIKEVLNDNEIIKEEEDDKKEEDDNYDNEFEDADKKDDEEKDKDNENKEKKDNMNESESNNEINNKFSSLSNINNNSNKDILAKSADIKSKEDDLEHNLKIDELIKNNEQIKEELPPINQSSDILNKNNKEIFESGSMESDYIIDVTTIDKFKAYLLKQAEVFDDDFIYSAMHIPTRKYVPPPDPQVVFEFCANIMILTKMEKEVIIITLLYLERFIFNTGLLLTSRNWRRIIFITMAIASKIWDDDSFENNHFAQVFKHLSIGEINLLERTFLELINYKVYVKCSEYFKYFFIIKSIALKYNYNGVEMIPISVERMMKIQEYAYQMQKRVRKKVNLSNSTKF